MKLSEAARTFATFLVQHGLIESRAAAQYKSYFIEEARNEEAAARDDFESEVSAIDEDILFHKGELEDLRQDRRAATDADEKEVVDEEIEDLRKLLAEATARRKVVTDKWRQIKGDKRAFLVAYLNQHLHGTATP